MNFRQLLLKYVTGNLPTDQIPDIGKVGLEEGIDTPSLCILAGLEKNEDSYVMERYLELTLEELNIQLPDKRQAALEYACLIANEIIEGKKDIILGIGQIYNQAINSYDFWSENKQYCYDSIGFEKAYGLYVEYDDILAAEIPNKPIEQLKNEIKVQLLDELIIWVEKIKLLS